MPRTSPPLPRPPAGGESFALLFAALFPLVGTYLYFVALSGTRWMTPVYAAFKVVQFSFPLLWIAGVERARPHLFRRPGTKGLWFGLFSGLGLVGALVAVWRRLLAVSVLAGV